MNTAVTTGRSPVRLRLTPSTGLIGIDIGSRFSKFAQVRRQRGRWLIAALHTVRTPGDQPLAEESLLNGVLSRSLAGLNLRATGFRGQRCATLLTGAIAEPRTLHLPDATIAEIDQMIRLELEDDAHGRANGEAIEFDFWSSPDAELSDRTKRVSVVQASRQASETVTLDLRQHGLNCEVIDGLPFALARAVNFVDPQCSRGTYAAIDWGCHEPLFVVVKDGGPVFHRVLRDCGLETAITSIRNEFSASRFEACRLLAAVGICGARTSNATLSIRQAVARCIDPVVDRLLDQVRRSFDFLRQQSGHLVPQSLWLLGGGAALLGVEETFASRFDVPCRVWQPATAQIARDVPANGRLAPFGAAVGLSLLVEEI
jgi:Tfp pilus assembly PilM family ATPase